MNAPNTIELRTLVPETPPEPYPAFVELRDVTKSYGANLVVMNRMSLDMRADDRLVIICCAA
jgi:polar amino acid transport system ATP-binding protein